MDGQNSAPSVVGPLSHSVPSLRLAFKSLLSREPWNHDPNVNSMPYRPDLERQVEDNKHNGGLVFGVVRHDHQATPWPPIQRAIDHVVEKLKKAGHKVGQIAPAHLFKGADKRFQVIEWDTSSHSQGCALIVRGTPLKSKPATNSRKGKTWEYDGGLDIHQSFQLSGEPMSPELMYEEYADQPRRQYTASEIAQNNIEIREFRKEYMERWNETEQATGTGRPVDAIISPVAPSPSTEPLRYRYYNYTTWVNILDYPSCVFPVTHADEDVDRPFENFKPLSDVDADLMRDCKLFSLSKAGI